MQITDSISENLTNSALESIYHLIAKTYIHKKSPVKTTGTPVRPYLTLFSGYFEFLFLFYFKQIFL